jgi:uncharacterized protein YdeI (YjbR/CyaY-like superfamily)
MGMKDPRVDAYIARSAEFAQPILTHLRDTVHDACPEVEEAIKWGIPHFMYRGMLCSMAGFKQHCVFGFWKGTLILGEGANRGEEAMGHLGRITTVSDLPSPELFAGYIQQAMRLNEEGVQPPDRAKSRARAELAVPDYLTAALHSNQQAAATFEAFSPSHRREYVEWLSEAKSETTRQRRLDTAIEWLAEGKPRNWKYIKS